MFGVPKTPQSMSPSYRLAYADEDFLCREELRPVRLQLELLKLQTHVENKGGRFVAIFEGRDASGKGSCIRYFLERLNPRLIVASIRNGTSTSQRSARPGVSRARCGLSVWESRRINAVSWNAGHR